MANAINEVAISSSTLEKELHPAAKELANELIDQFASDLLLQAKTLARHDEIVLTSHVKKADTVLSLQGRSNWIPDLAIFVGGAFIGVFLPWVISIGVNQAITGGELRAYIIVGSIGLLAALWGFFAKYK